MGSQTPNINAYLPIAIIASPKSGQFFIENTAPKRKINKGKSKGLSWMNSLYKSPLVQNKLVNTNSADIR
jgi:hypothetical protein